MATSDMLAAFHKGVFTTGAGKGGAVRVRDAALVAFLDHHGQVAQLVGDASANTNERQRCASRSPVAQREGRYSEQFRRRVFVHAIIHWADPFAGFTTPRAPGGYPCFDNVLS